MGERRKLRQWVPRPVKEAARPLARRLGDIRDRRHGLPVPPWSLRSQVAGDFRAVGWEFVRYMVDLGGLGAGDRVLDVGCKAGRLSIPLTTYLGPDAQYEGVDDWPEGTAWCQRILTPRFPNFRFYQVEKEVAAAEPAEASAAPPLRLPYEDSSFDFVILCSINKLSPARFDDYLRESSRLLRPGGTYLGTWYVYDDGDPGPPDVPSPVVGTESEVRRRLASLGLELESVHRGSWGGYEPALSYQDVIVARKVPSSKGPG